MTDPNPSSPAFAAAEPVDAPGYPRESERSLFDFLADVPPPNPSVEPIGFAHNGFHVDEEQFQPLSRSMTSGAAVAERDAQTRHPRP